MSVSASGGGVRSAYDAAVTAVAAVGGGFSMQHRIRRPLMTPGVVVVSSSRPPPARRRRAVDASPGLQRRNDDGYIRSTANPRTVRPLPSQQHQQPISFEPSFPRPLEPPEPDLDGRKPPDERKVKLGKTLRILQERLPTLLLYPLPQEILAPNITLHLFPTTHPHLPTVSGRVAYVAALWTSPIAWNRIPVIGNVELEILSERVFDHPVHPTPRRPLGAYPEQLIVKWRTMGGKKNGSPKWGLRFLDKEGHVVRREGEAGEGEFTGLFVFEFDGQGRIISHTIERVEEGGDWLKGVGAKVVGITEWILSGIRGGRKADEGPCPAFSAVGPGPEVVGNRG